MADMETDRAGDKARAESVPRTGDAIGGLSGTHEIDDAVQIFHAGTAEKAGTLLLIALLIFINANSKKRK